LASENAFNKRVSPLNKLSITHKWC
jgi:hypothetical protein